MTLGEKFGGDILEYGSIDVKAIGLVDLLSVGAVLLGLILITGEEKLLKVALVGP